MPACVGFLNLSFNCHFYYKVNIESRIYEYELKSKFKISRSTKTHQKALIVKISSGDYHGYGETIEYPFYDQYIGDLKSLFDSKQKSLQALAYQHPFDFYDQMKSIVANPFLACAIDEAYWDLYGKLEGKPTHEILNASTDLPKSTFTLSMNPIEEILAEIERFPWGYYKVKLGDENDVATMKALTEKSDAKFRIDANCAWDLSKLESISAQLKTMGVEYIEQPLPPGSWEDMATAIGLSHLPLIADEDCHGLEDLSQLRGLYNGINIKLTKCGGITPAFRMIKMAREMDLSVMIGCMTEGWMGISAAAQLGGLADYLDLDGAIWIKNNIATGVALNNGVISLNSAPGNGVHFHGQIFDIDAA